jgi:hypothetical protein
MKSGESVKAVEVGLTFAVTALVQIANNQKSKSWK